MWLYQNGKSIRFQSSMTTSRYTRKEQTCKNSRRHGWPWARDETKPFLVVPHSTADKGLSVERQMLLPVSRGDVSMEIVPLSTSGAFFKLLLFSPTQLPSVRSQGRWYSDLHVSALPWWQQQALLKTCFLLSPQSNRRTNSRDRNKNR